MGGGSSSLQRSLRLLWPGETIPEKNPSPPGLTALHFSCQSLPTLSWMQFWVIPLSPCNAFLFPCLLLIKAHHLNNPKEDFTRSLIWFLFSLSSNLYDKSPRAVAKCTLFSSGALLAESPAGRECSPGVYDPDNLFLLLKSWWAAEVMKYWVLWSLQSVFLNSSHYRSCWHKKSRGRRSFLESKQFFLDLMKLIILYPITETCNSV